ncbi:MAG: hypothetical protein PHY28_04865 [Dehalococcoidales bacterium]|nr:hypothetical protein [Dehalococcoidales bacterium]
MKKEKKRLTIIFSLLVILLVATSGCQPTQTIEITTTTGTPPTTVVLAADDVIITPGGYAYRANVHEQGVNNPFIPVQIAVVSLIGDDDIQLNYRKIIETKAGETRNNILWLYGADISGKQGMTVMFTPENLPSGVEAEQAQTTVSPMTKAVMSINIFPQVKQGDYTFNIRIEIDGKDYGQVPCTIKVID